MLALAALLSAGCGAAEEGPLVLAFDTEPTCAAADASCINAGTETFTVRGIPVIYKRLQGHPLVAMRVTFEADPGKSRQSWAEASALELFSQGGSRHFTGSGWQAELLRLGSAASAGAGLDYGSIRAVAPAPNWRAVWDLLVDGMLNYRNFPDELTNVLGSYEQGFLSELDDPSRAANIDAWLRLFYQHPYNYQHDHPDILDDLSPDDIARAWAALLTNDRMRITVVGDVDRTELEDELDESAAALLAGVPSVPFLADVVLRSDPQPDRRVLPYPDAPTWNIVSRFRGPPADSPDYAALDLGLRVLDRRLFEEIRDVRGLAYTTGASLAFYRESFGSLWITSDAPLEALPVARGLIASLETTGPSGAELAAARSSTLSQLLSSNDTPSGIGATLADWELMAGSRFALDAYVLALEQTTPAQVATALTTYLRGAKTAAAGGGSELGEADLEGLFGVPCAERPVPSEPPPSQNPPPSPGSSVEAASSGCAEL